MPQIDMPLEELRQYQGRNPRPADFDRFWDEGIAEMRSIDPQVQQRPAEFQAPFAQCTDLFFTGVAGARVHAKLVRPNNADSPHPAIVMFHGYSINSGEWFDKLPYAAMGCTVAALDCRGQAGQSEDVGGVTGHTLKGHIVRGLDDKPEKMLYREIFLDAAQLAGIVMDMPDVDEARVGAKGESQGGALTLACAALEPRIKLAAPCFLFLCDYQRVWDMGVGGGAYEEITRYFRDFDPLHEREDEIFTKLGYIDVQHLASRVRAKVRMTIALMDDTCPPSTQFAAYNKIQSEKELVMYPDFQHEDLPGVSDAELSFFSAL